MRTSELDLVAIKDAAWRIAEQRIAEGWAVSKRDAILRHGMGLYGEHAVTHYLNRQGFTVRSIAEDWQAILDRLGDLEVVSPDGGVVVRLEVKTTTLRAWVVRGPAQIKPMRADAVVWCSIPDDPAPRTVRLLGCSLLPLDDARRPTLRDTQALSPWIRGRWAGQG